MIRRVWLSLGSNQGDRWAHLSDTLSALREDSRVHQVRCSQVFETAPVGGPPQGRFLNCVVELVTDIAAHDVLELAHQLESAADRQRVERWGPRTLDVDIIAIEGEQQRILLREQGRVRGRGRQQVEGHGANYDAEHQQIGHRAAFQRRAEIGQLQHHGLTLQRCQSELRFQSRDARALS